MKNNFFLLLMLPLYIFAQNVDADMQSDSAFIHQLSNNILSSSSAYDNLHYLTKNIGGRLAGSPQMVQAENWGVKALKEAGADTVIMQECKVPHWVRGGKDAAYVEFIVNGKKQRYTLNILALGNSLGSGAKGVKAPLMRVNDFDELERRRDEIKRKIVFYNVPFDDTLVNTFEAYIKNVVYRGIGASRAAKYGAVGMLMRSMTNTPGNNPHTGSMRYNDSFPKIPAAAMGLQDVAKLDSLFDDNTSVTASLFTYGKMLPDTIGHNIIGVIKGSEHPEQIITVGGHLDSWDAAEGANDDGTGIVQSVELLRAFKATHYQPKHTIHIVLFANEENGTRGANKYAEEAMNNKEQHIFALESDAGGFTPRGFGFDVSDSTWQKLNSWKYLFEPYHAAEFTKGGGDTDIDPLHEKLKTPTAGFRPDGQRYFDIHHAATDVFENVSIREMKMGAVVMSALIYMIDKHGL